MEELITLEKVRMERKVDSERERERERERELCLQVREGERSRALRSYFTCIRCAAVGIMGPRPGERFCRRAPRLDMHHARCRALD